MADEYIRFVEQRATPKAMSTRSVEEESDIDDELISVRQYVSEQEIGVIKSALAISR